MGVSEPELLAKIADGDERALADLYASYERRLFGFGLRLLGDRGLAEEVVQETFVKLWRNAKKFDESRGAPATFILTIARGVAVDLWRRPSSRPFDSEPPDSPGPGDFSEDVANAQAVRDALASLSPPHREILELLHFQGLTQAEAAGVLGIPVGTVKTRSAFALRALRVALSERDFHE